MALPVVFIMDEFYMEEYAPEKGVGRKRKNFKDRIIDNLEATIARGGAEHVIQRLKRRLEHVKKDQGLISAKQAKREDTI